MTYYMPTKEKRFIRHSLMQMQRTKCAYCSRVLVTDRRLSRRANFATLDHLTPLALGGASDPDNLVLCCRLCNIVKGHSTLEEFVFGLLWVWLWKNQPVLAFELRRTLAGQAVV